MTERPTAEAVDAYIAGFPPDKREALEHIRAVIRSAAPDAVETISYAIPTFDQNGKHVVHYAAFKNHLGFYPTGEGAAAFAEELSAYGGSKGSVHFPYDQPIPEDLVRRIVLHRVAKVGG